MSKKKVEAEAQLSSAEWTAKAEELKKQLEEARKEARNMKKLEEQKAKEEERQKEIRDALKFYRDEEVHRNLEILEFAKTMFFQNGSGDSYYDAILKRYNAHVASLKNQNQSAQGTGTASEN